MNSEGGDLQQLTTADQNTNDREPIWSPDGRQIAFTRGHEGGMDIMVMNADGSNLRNRTNYTNGEAGLMTAWSPDSTRIAFSQQRLDGKDPKHDIFIANVDGSGVTQITRTSMWNLFPSWSPDGSRLVFASDMDSDDGITSLYISNTDGSGLHRLTRNDDYNGGGAWSPDGEWIAFLRADTAGEQPQLWLISADGSTQAAIPNTVGEVGGMRITWSPDGQQIAYITVNGDPNDSQTRASLNIINRDGSGHRVIGDNVAIGSIPRWAPRPVNSGPAD